MKKGYIVLIVVVLIIAGYFIFRSPSTSTYSDTNPSDMDMTPVTPQVTTPEQTVQQNTATAPHSTPQTVTFNVVGGNYYFTPKTMTVKKGDRVVINFQNAGGTHNFIIDEFNVATKTINTGQTDTIQFVADKAGTFEYYCSIGSHRAMGMKGTLTVTE
jgi:nitrosocyanin